MMDDSRIAAALFLLHIAGGAAMGLGSRSKPQANYSAQGGDGGGGWMQPNSKMENRLMTVANLAKKCVTCQKGHMSMWGWGVVVGEP